MSIESDTSDLENFMFQVQRLQEEGKNVGRLKRKVWRRIVTRTEEAASAEQDRRRQILQKPIVTTKQNG